MIGRRRWNRVFGRTEGIEPFPGRGGERRKWVGGIGIGIGSGSGTTCRIVDGFKRRLRFRLLPERQRKLSSSTVVYVTLLLHFLHTTKRNTKFYYFILFFYIYFIILPSISQSGRICLLRPSTSQPNSYLRIKPISSSQHF